MVTRSLSHLFYTVAAAVGLVLALQGSLALALTAYDTAEPSDILDATQPTKANAPPRLARLGLLLRRAGSERYLADPERLVLSNRQREALRSLGARRNRILHPFGDPVVADADDRATETGAALAVLTHVLMAHPAFDPAAYPGELAVITGRIRQLTDTLPP